jgi:predicted MFS family arabinose efflux permease
MKAVENSTPILKLEGVAPLLIIVAMALASFSILLPLSPTWAIARGASEAAAGAVTTVLMIFTIISQLGLPAVMQITGSSYFAILISSAIRGMGFGIVTVGGATAIALLVPAHRRGAAIGIYGLAMATPQLIFISAAPVIEKSLGSHVVGLIATLPLLGLLAVRGLADLLQQRMSEQPAPARSADASYASTVRLILPALLLLLIATSTGGAIFTFANQISFDITSASITLLCITGFATPARWVFGVLGDRVSHLSLLAFLCALFIGGMTMLTLSLFTMPPASFPTLLYAGSVLIGVAYGGLQSATMVYAFKAAGIDRLTHVSVLWNVTFDMGTGVGAVIVGALATIAGFNNALVCTTVISLLICAGALFSLSRKTSSA